MGFLDEQIDFAHRVLRVPHGENSHSFVLQPSLADVGVRIVFGVHGCTYTPRAAEAVIMAVTALEAGANEMIEWVRQGVADAMFASTITAIPADYDVRTTRLAEKWRLLPRILVGRELDRGAQPWQDFKVLVGLRDELVHFKWHRADVPNFMRSLQTRDLTIPDDPAIYWVDAALTDRVAAWATMTCEKMFAALACLLNNTNPLSWPWQ